MLDYADVLRRTLEGKKQTAQVPDRDLPHVIAALSKGVEEVTENRI